MWLGTHSISFTETLQRTEVQKLIASPPVGHNWEVAILRVPKGGMAQHRMGQLGSGFQSSACTRTLPRPSAGSPYLGAPKLEKTPVLTLTLSVTGGACSPYRMMVPKPGTAWMPRPPWPFQSRGRGASSQVARPWGFRVGLEKSQRSFQTLQGFPEPY